jgi:hypothetical protein
MSWLEEQIPVFNEAFDALERGDLRRWTELTSYQFHPECEFHSGIGSVVGGGSYKGPEGIRDWFRDLIEVTSERHWRNRSWDARGDELLVFLADFEIIGSASGARTAGETGAVAQYEDRLCVRMDSFMSHAQAREFAEARVA